MTGNRTMMTMTEFSAIDELSPNLRKGNGLVIIVDNEACDYLIRRGRGICISLVGHNSSSSETESRSSSALSNVDSPRHCDLAETRPDYVNLVDVIAKNRNSPNPSSPAIKRKEPTPYANATDASRLLSESVPPPPNVRPLQRHTDLGLVSVKKYENTTQVMETDSPVLKKIFDDVREREGSNTKNNKINLEQLAFKDALYVFEWMMTGSNRHLFQESSQLLDSLVNFYPEWKEKYDKNQRTSLAINVIEYLIKNGYLERTPDKKQVRIMTSYF